MDDKGLQGKHYLTLGLFIRDSDFWQFLSGNECARQSKQCSTIAREVRQSNHCLVAVQALYGRHGPSFSTGLLTAASPFPNSAPCIGSLK